ncbi:type II toxin-antitoxin system Phd/YefM family antitoxin [uncultured Methylobacterium sp.]|uniref:type II toxin-antitoxin system Phd/YefM family antitoxin n=1 Tax=uncultured Methylobacterium sp. TaxID=157278 RepID=UPI0035CAB252
MTSIALENIGSDFADLARRVEGGETIVVTRAGKPILDLVPHRRKGGIDYAAGEAFLRAHGIERTAGFIADDFDDPLPEDFLIRPLPGP